MSKIFKAFLYLLACAIVFFFLVKFAENVFTADEVRAFEWEKNISVYFGNKNMGSSEDCTKTFPVSRTILNAETFGPGALEALLGGISDREEELGYFSSINKEALLQKFEIKDGVAYIDFDSNFNKGVAGSCRVQSIMSQIENTLINLPDIDSIVISVNGETEGILEP